MPRGLRLNGLKPTVACVLLRRLHVPLTSRLKDHRRRGILRQVFLHRLTGSRGHLSGWTCGGCRRRKRLLSCRRGCGLLRGISDVCRSERCPEDLKVCFEKVPQPDPFRSRPILRRGEVTHKTREVTQEDPARGRKGPQDTRVATP